LDTYFLASRKYGPGLAKLEIRDQYSCRALFALGGLVAARAAPLKGQPLVDGVLEAVKHIMAGLAIAGANPRYAGLVYNGTVHYWHAARPLQRDRMRPLLLPSQEAVCAALDKVPELHEWKARNAVNLGVCQWEAGRGDAALASLQKALDIAVAQKLPLKAEVAALLVHVGCALGKPPALGGAAAGGKAPAKGAPAKGAPPPPPAGALDVDGALTIVQGVLSTKVADVKAAEASLREAWAKVDPKPTEAGRNAALDVVGRARPPRLPPSSPSSTLSYLLACPACPLLLARR